MLLVSACACPLKNFLLEMHPHANFCIDNSALLKEGVVSIGLFLSQFVRFCTVVEYVRSYYSFLLVTSQLIKKVPMEMETLLCEKFIITR